MTAVKHALIVAALLCAVSAEPFVKAQTTSTAGGSSADAPLLTAVKTYAQHFVEELSTRSPASTTNRKCDRGRAHSAERRA